MKTKGITFLTILVSIFFAFNVFAMSENRNINEYVSDTPATEMKNENQELNYRWLWLNDEVCIQFKIRENAKLEEIQRMHDAGLLPRWCETTSNGKDFKNRDTYVGKWSQSTDGIWSFEFDDFTIPVGITKIDEVLYAFNSFGELKEGYKYWGDLITGSDGKVVSDNPEFLVWMSTQYIPVCTSHE